MTILSLVSGSYFTRLCLKYFVEYTMLHVQITKNHFKKSFQPYWWAKFFFYCQSLSENFFNVIKASVSVILVL